ncbi:MAG TPA: nickel insertion protein [Terriglobales bacterium]|nr:nickel insertion protein [Terriglobales bacterium]
MTTEKIYKIETTLDDESPQVIGYVLERALELGALDAYTVAAQMKKNRPGVLLTLLARAAEREVLVRLLLTETTTLGVRVEPSVRVVLKRKMRTIETEYGAIRVKVAAGKSMPEYEDCRAAARRAGVPLRMVLKSISLASK